MYVVKDDTTGDTTPVEQELTQRKFQVKSGPQEAAPKDIDCLVKSQQRWMWDLTMYLLELKVDFLDPKTGALFASGRIYRPSLIRRSPEFMAHEVMEKALGETVPAGSGGK